MPKTTAPRAQITETKFDDHVVIVPPNRLKSYVTRTGDSMEIATDPIARAETALKQIKGEFRGWMNTECDTIEAVRAAIHDDGPTEQSIERLFNAAHDIIGHADVFGFPLARKIAESLCHLISSASQPAKLPLKLIDVTVGRANPPDSIKSQRIETAAQEQRANTERQRKLAEDQRKEAEQARAASDNAYRNALGMSAEQFIQLEAIHAQRDVCMKGGCTMIMGGGSPLVNVGK